MPLSQLGGFGDILSRAGIHTNINLGDLLATALDLTGHGDAGSALRQFGGVVQAINGLPTFPAGSTVNLGDFTATVTAGGALRLGDLPGGSLLQQLGGAYADFAAQLAGIGVSLPSEATLLGVLLGGNANVPLFTCTRPSISANVPVINEPLATIGTPIPGITLNGEITGSFSLQLGGTVGMMASGLLSGDLASAFFAQNAVLSAGLSIGPAGSIDLGVNGLSLIGYQVAGLFNLSGTATFRADSFAVTPSVSNSVSCQWVGPTFNPSQLNGATIYEVDPAVLVYHLEIQGTNSLLQQWGLPTIPDVTTSQGLQQLRNDVFGSL
jgi:hypothetical protein